MLFRIGSIILFAAAAAAQTGNGSVQGTVKDPTGAVIPAAAVSVEQISTARKYLSESNERGAYVFPSLPIGSYRITVESAGLETFRGNFLLQTGQTAVVDAVLKVNSTSTEVTVSADGVDITPVLTTTEPTLANVVERQRIEQLPINGRFFQNLIQITTPGVEGTGSPRVYGLRAGSMEFMQDGASLNHRNLGSISARPPDSITPFARGSFGASAFDPRQPTSRAEEYNLTLETTILGDTLLRAGYVGTRGRNVDLWMRLNDAPNNYVWFQNTGLPLPTGEFSGVARRPLDNQRMGQIDLYTRRGYSNFNGAQFEVSRRYKSGYSYQFFYVLSNALSTGNIDTGDSAANAVFNPEIYLTGSVPQDVDVRNRFLNYRRDVDIPRHRLRWNYLMDLPFGKGKKWLSGSGRLVNTLAGGWQIAGFGSYRSRYWTLPTSNWGSVGNIEVYGKQHKVEDCRSGICIPGYLWWNGYIPANRINSVDAQGRPNGVMGVPADYRPSHLPVWPTPADGGVGDPNFALFDSNQVTVRLRDGSEQRTVLDTLLHPWRQQFMNAPWVFDFSASIFKTIPLTERGAFRLNADFFQVLNNPGLGTPGATGILSLQNSNNAPRELQLTLRLTY